MFHLKSQLLYNNSMRKITLKKRFGALGKDLDVKVMVNGQIISELKVGEEEKSIEVYNGSQVVVCQVEDEDKNIYRSNSFFLTGSKSAVAFLDINGMRINIKER